MRVHAIANGELRPAVTRSWERIRGAVGRLAPASILLGLGLWAFHGPLAGRIFYLRDISQNHRPVRQLVTTRLLQGDLPIWNPYHGAGTPLLADPNHLVLHPISLLFLALPFETAFTASILLQFALLGAGGWLLARRTGVSRAGAGLASAILMFSGPAASLASLQNVLSAAAWVPIGIWALLRGFEPGGRRFLPGAAVALAIVLMTAEPASALAFLLLAAVFVIAAPETGGTIPGPGVAPVGAGSSSPSTRMWKTAAVLGLGGLIAAVQILPARALLEISTRGAGFAPGEALKWSLEPVRLLELIVPRLFGDPTRLAPGSWWGRWVFEGGYPFLPLLYLGAAPCVLAIVALVSRPRPAWVRGIGVVGAIGALLALGRHGMVYRGLYDAVPIVGQIRYPERFILITLFAVALLAAHGLGRVLEGARIGPTRWLVGAAAAGFAGATLIAGMPSVVDRFLTSAAGVPGPVLVAVAPALRGAALGAVLWVFLELAVLAGIVMVARRHPGRPAVVMAGGWGLVTVAGVSLIMAGAPALSSADPGWLAAPSPLAAVLDHGPGAPRVHHAPRPAGLSVWGQSDELIWGYRFDRFSYSLATGHPEGVPTVLDAATDRMDLAAQSGLGRALPGVPVADQIKILSLCGAGTLLTYDPVDHPALVPGPVLEGFSRPALRVYRLREVLPRARFRAHAVPPAVPGDLVASLTDPGYDPRRMVLLDGVPRLPSPVVAADGEVAIVEDQPEKIGLWVRAGTAGWVVLADAHAPGWSATVDGEPAPVLKADGLFRAVPVTAGDHEVVMTYRAPAAGAGLGAGLAGLLIAAVWAAAPARRGPA